MAALTISQLARTAVVNVQTIRYYERLNLLTPTRRTTSGYRLYDHEAEGRLRFIRQAQTMGFTLREIRDLLTVRTRSTTRCSDIRNKAEAKLLEVRSKMRQLKALAGTLEELIRLCPPDQLTHCCPILHRLEDKALVMDARTVGPLRSMQGDHYTNRRV